MLFRVQHYVISTALELLYFGHVRRVRELEETTSEAIAILQGRSSCQSRLLSILARNLNDAQNRDVEELIHYYREAPDGPENDGALNVIREFRD